MSYLLAILSRLRRVLLVLCVLLWLGAIAATHAPLPELPKIPGGDKSLHLVGFSGLTTIFMLTLISYGVVRGRRIPLAIAVLSVYGTVDEHTQPYFNRTCDYRDWLMDMGGMLIAMIVLELLLAAAQWVHARRLKPVGRVT